MNPSPSKAARAAVAAAAFVSAVLAQGAGPRPAGAAFALPLQFVANHGQWSQPARFCAASPGQTTWVVDDGFWTTAETADDRGVALRFSFVGSRSSSGAAGELPTGGVRHWLRSPAGGSVTGVPAFQRVRLARLYPGIDLLLRAQDGHLEYDLALVPGADAARIRVRVAGQQRLRLCDDGSLVLDTAVGELRQPPPAAFTTAPGGVRAALPCRFVLLGPDEFGFRIDGATANGATIDPGLIWGSFLAGTGADRCTQLGLDSQGRAVVGGETASTDLPTTPGSYRPSAHATGTDVFVAGFDATGSNLLFGTYLGGTGSERLESLRVLANDDVALGGTTFSTDFPATANGYQTGSGGGSDGFVAVLTNNGSTLAYASYYGGVGDQSQVRVSVQPNGDIFVAGRTTGTVPTTLNSYQGARRGVADAFLGVLDRQNPGSTSLTFGTYFGGTGDETEVTSLQVDASSLIATIGMATTSTDCPTTANHYQNTYPGGSQAGFIVRLQPGQASGPQSLVYASYYGTASGRTERLLVEMDSTGFMIACATTSGTTWPTSVVSYQRNYGGGQSDGIVLRLNPNAAGPTAILLTTYLGGSGDDVIEAFHFAYNPNVSELSTIVGSTTSTNFPVTAAALQAAPAGTGKSGFVAQIDTRFPAFAQLQYGSYFDACGSSDDVLHAVQRAAGGEITVAGETNGTVAPGTPGGFQRFPAGGTEGIVARLDTLPQPPQFSTFGSSCGAAGFMPLISGGTPPRMGQPFSCTVANLRSPGAGLMFMGLSDTSWFGVPLPRDLGSQGMPGCSQWISIDDSFLQVQGASTLQFGFTMPASMNFYGLDLFLQYAMLDPAANPFGVAVSNGARLNFQF